MCERRYALGSTLRSTPREAGRANRVGSAMLTAMTYSDVVGTITLVAIVPGLAFAIWQIMLTKRQASDAKRQASDALSEAQATKKAIGTAESMAARTALQEILHKLPLVEKKLGELIADGAQKDRVAVQLR
ncbi:hypothetical protein LCGC14_2371690, partial [marine sediment metagenome]